MASKQRQRAFRWNLPYGIWRCKDERQILYDRRYRPIAERSRHGHVTLIDDQWVYDIAEHRWFYDDATPEREKLKRAKRALEDWGILDEAIEHVRDRSPDVKVRLNSSLGGR